MAIYAKIGKINGDATHEDHKQWMTLDSLQWGVGRAIMTPVGSAKNREASEPSVSEVTVTKQMDEDRKSVVEGQSVSVRVDLGGRRRIKKKKKISIVLSKITIHIII